MFRPGCSQGPQSTRHYWPLVLLVVGMLAVCVVAFWSRGVRAATTWHVSPAGGGACTLADPNCPTIQAAVNAASSGDTIQLAAGTYRENVRINHGNTVANTLTIQGAGATTTIVDGTRSGAVFDIGTGRINFSGMTITRGSKTPNSDAIGPIYGGADTVTNCIITDNEAALGANSIVDTLITNNTGDYAASGLNIVRTTITNNVGGVFISFIGSGSSASIVDSNVSNNSGAGITIRTSEGTVNVSNSTVSQNMGSGISILSGFSATSNSPDLVVNISNTTISNNTTKEFGGGILNRAVLYSFGIFLAPVNVINSTISGNTAQGVSGDPICTGAPCRFFGGGIYNDSAGSPGGFRLKNTIVAGNTAASGPDLSGPFISQGHNLIGKSDGGSGFSNGTNGDFVGTIASPVAANLSQLGDHGGPGPTQLLRCSSPALDHGDNSGAPATDERGMPRPSGATVDIGAVEMGKVQFNFNDNGPGSLRQLIQDAQDGAVIDLHPCTTGEIILDSGPLLINKNLTLNGNSAGTLIVRRNSPFAPGFRMFEVAAGKRVNLSEMTVKYGLTTEQGGGILNHGTLTVSGLFLTENQADGGGGGIANPDGTLNILNSTMTYDVTSGFGGAIFNGPSGNSLGTATTTIRNSLLTNNGSFGVGGAIYNNGTEVTIINSTFTHDYVTATDQKGGAIYNNGTLNFIGSTANDNRAAHGGGIRNSITGVANIVNSTFSNDEIGGGGGAILNAGSMNLINVTISRNRADGGGGGIFNESTGTCRLQNTIVATNFANNSANNPAAGPDLLGQFISQGYNLIGIGDGSSGFTNGVNHDQVGSSAAPVDPMLLPLGNYGGPTQTLAPRLGSPAIDAGDNSVLQLPLNERFDQRGYPRPQTGVLVAPGCNCVDIGTVEFTPIIDARGGVIHFTNDFYFANEHDGSVVITVKRERQAILPATVDYATQDGSAFSCCDYEAQSGTLHFAAGQDTATITILINNDSFVEGPERAFISLSNPTGEAVLAGHSTAIFEIADDDTGGTFNQIDDQQSFVIQHYHDFLSREPDASGLAFWVGTITSCGANAQCVEVKRINASAAFFLSIEFQQTGYFVYRNYKAAFGDNNVQGFAPIPVHFDTFMRDTQSIGAGVIVGQGNWQAQLDTNKSAFMLSFVQSSAFLTRHPSGTTATNFVNALDANAGNPLTSQQKNDLILELAPNPNDPALRADVLRKVVDNSVFVRSEFNRAFVAAEYFGYLRRDPDPNGFAFWLAKLNSFNGDYIQAEMVKAFISSDEYRHRFGP